MILKIFVPEILRLEFQLETLALANIYAWNTLWGLSQMSFEKDKHQKWNKHKNYGHDRAAL